LLGAAHLFGGLLGRRVRLVLRQAVGAAGEVALAVGHLLRLLGLLTRLLLTFGWPGGLFGELPLFLRDLGGPGGLVAAVHLVRQVTQSIRELSAGGRLFLLRAGLLEPLGGFRRLLLGLLALLAGAELAGLLGHLPVGGAGLFL